MRSLGLLGNILALLQYISLILQQWIKIIWFSIVTMMSLTYNKERSGGFPMAFFQSGHVTLKHVRVSGMVNLICMMNVHPVQIYAVL